MYMYLTMQCLKSFVNKFVIHTWIWTFFSAFNHVKLLNEKLMNNDKIISFFFISAAKEENKERKECWVNKRKDCWVNKRKVSKKEEIWRWPRRSHVSSKYEFVKGRRKYKFKMHHDSSSGVSGQQSVVWVPVMENYFFLENFSGTSEGAVSHNVL